MTNIISGKELAATMRQEIKEETARLYEKTGKQPDLP
jgi:5,10-methylene-tetrahydrofolate dehydrogenase/methenyl tetrahydrofolate cyclohydrolase